MEGGMEGGGAWAGGAETKKSTERKTGDGSRLQERDEAASVLSSRNTNIVSNTGSNGQ